MIYSLGASALFILIIEEKLVADLGNNIALKQIVGKLASKDICGIAQNADLETAITLWESLKVCFLRRVVCFCIKTASKVSSPLVTQFRNC